jgi:hypothetical protein
VSDAVTSQFISDDFPRLIPAFIEKPFEEALSRLTISTSLQKNIDHLPLLVYRAPQITLLALNPHEYLIKEKCISISLVLVPQLPGIFRTKLDAPQTN